MLLAASLFFESQQRMHSSHPTLVVARSFPPAYLADSSLKAGSWGWIITSRVAGRPIGEESLSRKA